jgi:hypothetical protein
MLGGGTIENQNQPLKHSARVLLFSMRNLNRHVSRCASYEFESVIAECDSVDIIAPRRPPQRGESALRRCVKRVLRVSEPVIEDDGITLDKEYDLFVAFCRSAKDLRYIAPIEGLHDRCQRAICLFDELRTDAISKSPQSLAVLSRFDCIFSNIQESIETIRQVTERPCHFIPGGVDALEFCPYPRNPPRGIDVYSMGRRPLAMHHVLMSRGAANGIFYLYDTTSDFSIIDPKEHRLLLANLIKRSRYFITFPPKFDRPSEAPGGRDLGLRFFEGAAGGAVMLGMAPNCTAFRECFDWPDAVIGTPADGSEIATLIAELDLMGNWTDWSAHDGPMWSIHYGATTGSIAGVEC